jgi:hypothetical protein
MRTKGLSLLRPKVAEIGALRRLARPMLRFRTSMSNRMPRGKPMRRSNTYFGAAAFVAIALAMPLAALEPVAGYSPDGKAATAACGSKLATLCDRSAA